MAEDQLQATATANTDSGTGLSSQVADGRKMGRPSRRARSSNSEHDSNKVRFRPSSGGGGGRDTERSSWTFGSRMTRMSLAENPAPGHVIDQGAAVLNTYTNAAKMGKVSCGRLCSELGLLATLPTAICSLVLYFMIIPPLYSRTMLAARPLTIRSPCFSPEPTVCNDGPPTRHYIWNLTNAREVSEGRNRASGGKLDLSSPHASLSPSVLALSHIPLRCPGLSFHPLSSSCTLRPHPH